MRFKQKMIGSIAAISLTTGLAIPSIAHQAAANPPQSSPPMQRPPLPMAGMMGMGSFLMGGMGGQLMPVDPLRSSIPSLIMRDDVRTELLISSEQREQIEQTETTSRQDMVVKLRSSIQELMGSMRRKGAPTAPDATPAPDDTLTPAQRRLKMEETQKKMQSSMNHMLDDLDAKLEKILRPKQIARLHELDLQFRGPLALLDPKVSDPFMLSSEERTKLDQLGGEYQGAQLRVMSNAMRGSQFPIAPPSSTTPPVIPPDPNAPAGPSLPGGPTNRQPAPPFDPQAMQARLADARVEAEKTRKEIGKKALTLISPAHVKLWYQMTGKPFIFRPNL